MHLLLISYEGSVEKVRDVLCSEQRKRSGFFAVDQFVIGHFQHFAESLQLDIRDIALFVSILVMTFLSMSYPFNCNL